MRHLPASLLLSSVLALTGCGSKSTSDTTAENAASATPEPATPAPATPAPTTPAPIAAITPAPVIATPAPDPIAPAGVFYTLEKVSVTTEDGIFGVPAGTRVQQVSPGHYRDASNHQLTLADRQVTNNLRIAGQAAQGDAAAQAAIRQSLAARAAANKAATATPAAVSATPQPIVAQPVVAATLPTAPLPTPERAVMGTSSLNATPKSTKNIQTDALGRKYWIDIYGKFHYVR